MSRTWVGVSVEWRQHRSFRTSCCSADTGAPAVRARAPSEGLCIYEATGHMTRPWACARLELRAGWGWLGCSPASVGWALCLAGLLW